MAELAVERKIPKWELIQELLQQKNQAELCTVLQIETIHISELEELTPGDLSKCEGKAVVSWAPLSFIEEWIEPTEIPVGTYDKEWLLGPACKMIENSVPPTVDAPFPLYLKTAVPGTAFVGRAVRHPETGEIAKITLDPKTGHLPTIGFVYRPSDITWYGAINDPKWVDLPTLMLAECNMGPLTGRESMGALFVSSRDDVPVHWCGSVLTCEESRALGCRLSPTALQVAAGVYSHTMLALKYPKKGMVRPGAFDPYEIIELARPYLGRVLNEDLDVKFSAKWSEMISDTLE
jgi:homospermidine synthase